MSNKLPQELELEDLLKAVENIDIRDVQVCYDDPILSFTQAFGLVPGDDYVSKELLYKLFGLWHPDSVFKYKSFTARLGKYIPAMQIGNRSFFCVNKNFLSISKQIQDMLREKKVDKTKSKAWSKHYIDFLDATGIKPGTIFIEAEILYYVYNRWRDKNKKKTILSYDQFCALSKLHFEKKSLSRNRKVWYGVNTRVKSFITKEEVLRWRESKKNAQTQYLHAKSNKILYKEKVKKKQK